MNLRQLYRKIYKVTVGRFYPIKYAKKVGVNIKGSLHIYGKIDWGTEPWIITIGNNVHLTDNIRIITHDGGTLIFRRIVPDLEITKPVVIGDNVYVGNSVIILPGVTIGNNVIIGAGSIVTKDVPSNSLVAGVPARVIKTAEEYFRKIQAESLHLGHLKGEEKDKALKKYYNYKGKSKGIYF